jgi:hypothetical protein
MPRRSAERTAADPYNVTSRRMPRSLDHAILDDRTGDFEEGEEKAAPSVPEELLSKMGSRPMVGGSSLAPARSGAPAARRKAPRSPGPCRVHPPHAQAHATSDEDRPGEPGFSDRPDPMCKGQAIPQACSGRRVTAPRSRLGRGTYGACPFLEGGVRVLGGEVSRAPQTDRSFDRAAHEEAPHPGKARYSPQGAVSAIPP